MRERPFTSHWKRLAALVLTLGVTLLGTAVTPAAASPTTDRRGPAGIPGPPQYQITIINESVLANFNAIVFQQHEYQPYDHFTLAWMSRPCYDRYSECSFTWDVQYDFVWGREGRLGPGVNYRAGGILPTDLKTNNRVGVYFDTGELEFGPAHRGDEGSMTIFQDDTVPDGAGNVGIGMSGLATTVVPTRSSSELWFRPSPSPIYWIAFGTQQQGDVLHMDHLISPLPLRFPDGSTEAEAAFDGTDWRITYYLEGGQPSPSHS